MTIDNNENIYLLFFDNERLSPFLLRKNTNIPIKINGVTGHTSHIFADNNNNIYVGSGNGLYMLKSGETTATKIKGINKKYGSFVNLYKDKKYDIIYFKTGGGLYKLNGGENKLSKIIEGKTLEPLFFTSDYNHHTYYKDFFDKNIYFLKKDQILPNKINGINNNVISIETDKKNNVYFITNVVYIH
ncbi:hypothetical protein [Spiroplasma endosymbiont of Agriotes lineatus]|uniref:hypothetical protein n=1 Tax=Spiroplasma endosymbiont of Agriotes lineatus TaxID=3077930 RepID=UPI0030CEA6D8